jgi:hypothetical protein
MKIGCVVNALEAVKEFERDDVQVIFDGAVLVRIAAVRCP